ncbi:MAG: murein biosynthesis integral membrane protein MurJ [Pseudomonadales bacterium]
MPPSQSTKPAGGLLRSSLLVGSLTMLSRVLGLCRDVVIAIFIGANANADAFFIAFKVPNFLRRLFAEGAFSQAFVPVLSEYRTQRTHGEVRQLVNSVAGALGVVLLGTCVLAVLAAPLVTVVFAPGFYSQPEKFTLTSELLRITFPYLLLISLAGFAGSILNSYNRFAVPAFTPVLLNLSLIAGALLLAPRMEQPVFALAWAVIIAGILQLALQFPFLSRIGLMPRPRVDWGHPGVKRILVLMVPALFGVSVSQINLLLDTVLASFLPTGSVSWLYYSDRLVELPLGVFGIAVATVILPTLSRQHSDSGAEQFARPLDWAMRMVLLVSVPATAALLVLAEPLLMTLFNYGTFTGHDATMASFSLQAYALGLLAFMLIKVLAAGYYAQQDMKTPVRIGIIAMVVNMVLNVVFVVPLYFLFNIGHVGLALATSLAAFVNAGLLLRGLLRTDVVVWQSGFLKNCARVLAAALAMAVFLLLYKGDTALWQALDVYGRAFRTLWLCAAGAAIYFLVLALLGARLSHFRTRSH